MAKFNNSIRTNPDSEVRTYLEQKVSGIWGKAPNVLKGGTVHSYYQALIKTKFIRYAHS